MIAIVARSHEIVKSKWPQAEFHIILWDGIYCKAPKIKSQLIDGLQKHEMNLHIVSTIIPDILENESEYKILNDLHPNAKAHDLIAGYVVEHILQKSDQRIK